MRLVTEWLEEKARGGVKQVRVSSVLAKIAEASEPVNGKKRGAHDKVTITPGDLIGAFEAAELLGVDRTRPSKWRNKGTTFGPDKVPFPAPYVELATGPVWLRSEVLSLRPFVEQRRRNKGSDE